MQQFDVVLPNCLYVILHAVASNSKLVGVHYSPAVAISLEHILSIVLTAFSQYLEGFVLVLLSWAKRLHCVCCLMCMCSFVGVRAGQPCGSVSRGVSFTHILSGNAILDS